VVLLVRDQRLVRVLERLHDLLVIVEQVPDPLGGVDDVVEVELELLRHQPLDLPLELPERRPLRLDDLAVGDDLLLDLLDEGVELARVEAAYGRVVDREVEDGEEVATLPVLVAGIDVDLRALAPREDVLDVEWVPPEAAGQKLRLPVGRRKEVDPGDAAGA